LASILRQLFQAGSDPRYREERARLDLWRARILSGYCAVLYPSFWLLDLVVYPERARLFGLMRAGVVALAVPLLMTTYMPPRPWIAPAARALAVIATTAVGYMCAATEGFRSNYVIGVIICLMAISTIELFHMAQLLAVHGGVLVSYAGMNTWLAPHPATPDVVSSLAFLSGASCFCVVASGLLEYQRQRLFEAQALLGVRNGELERANQHQREFLRTITHELRTPLNATLGFVDLIRESEAQLSAANLRRLERIAGGSRRLLQIINDILDLSKIEAGRLATKSAPFNVFELLDEVGQLTRGLLHHRDVEVVVEAPLDLILQSDEARVRQILINLAGNAAKFTPSGRITLRATATEEGGVEMAVIDTGVGIPDAQHARVFEAFTQTAEGASKGGTGLGLNIVSRLMGLLGGVVGMRSEVDRGTTFTLRFPKTFQRGSDGRRSYRG
jgi:signal transduction histidine kinase